MIFFGSSEFVALDCLLHCLTYLLVLIFVLALVVGSCCWLSLLPFLQLLLLLLFLVVVVVEVVVVVVVVSRYPCKHPSLIQLT